MNPNDDTMHLIDYYYFIYYFIMKFILALNFLLFVTVSHSAPLKDHAEVMLMGTYHFSNPGLDVIKGQKIDVTTEANQAYLSVLTQSIAESFRPTDVLIECDRGEEKQLNAEYEKYLQGQFELLVNENYQIGFRLAKKSGVKRLSCYDEREVKWQAEALFKSLSESEPELKLEFEGIIKQFEEQANKMHQELSLGEVLTAMNSEELESQNKSLYILSNEVGANDEGYAGADATASWWHRNFRMYANIQKYATPGKRVFAIGGNGHTAILKDFLKLDVKRISKPVTPYF